MPGILVHPGASFAQLIDHLYLTTQGIYGIALGVVATYVFHFVLFGVFATRIGLGQLFLDCAAWVAGRYAGGPAKVAIFGSALFGMISGSSVANTVTVGSLTIPAMIRLGYKKHFAAAVESTASTGGQITPPIMGAAAFLMIEFLNLPYTTIILAAIVPAFMHFFGVFMQVHFEAKRNGLRGLRPEEMPDLREAFRRDWPTVIPLVALIGVLMAGYTPYLAAFWGITLCIAVGLLNPRRRMSLGEVFDGLRDGAKYALAVGAAAATVGIVVGVVTLTGVGFKFSYIVTSTAREHGVRGGCAAALQSSPTRRALTLLFTLIMTGVVCILMGCGIPTTANYIIMVTIAAPALGAARRRADRRALLRLLLRRARRHHAAGGARRLCGGRHGRRGSVPDRQHRLPPRPRQGAGAVRLRVLAVAAPRREGLQLAGFLARLRRLRRRHHLPQRRHYRLAPDPDRVLGAGAPHRRGDPARRAGALFVAPRRRARRAGADPPARRVPPLPSRRGRRIAIMTGSDSPAIPESPVMMIGHFHHDGARSVEGQRSPKISRASAGLATEASSSSTMVAARSTSAALLGASWPLPR